MDTTKKAIPLSVPNLSLEIMDYLKETIETGWVSTGGRFITEFQDAFAKYVKVSPGSGAVSCQSGTAGLHLALRVLGVQPGDEVIVPTLTFIASVNPIRYVGAEPVFMDCDDTLNLDLKKLTRFIEDECDFQDGKLINRLTKNQIKGIIPVHIFGNPMAMEPLMDLKDKYGLFILEDACEAVGSFYTEGKYQGQHCGTVGDIGVFSFNANKIITSGSGGMVVSRNNNYLEEINFLSVQAKTDPLRFIHNDWGYNYRMTNIQAAYGVHQLKQIEDFVAIKMQNYTMYKSALEEVEGLTILPFNEGTRANHWFYSLLIQPPYPLNVEELMMRLMEENVQTRPIWGLIHEQLPYVKNQAYAIDKASFYSQRILNLPCSTNLAQEDIQRVIDLIKSYVNE